MALAEEAIVIRMLIDPNVVEERGTELIECYKQIEEDIDARPDARATTKDEVLAKSVENY